MQVEQLCLLLSMDKTLYKGFKTESLYKQYLHCLIKINKPCKILCSFKISKYDNVLCSIFDAIGYIELFGSKNRVPIIGTNNLKFNCVFWPTTLEHNFTKIFENFKEFKLGYICCVENVIIDKIIYE